MWWLIGIGALIPLGWLGWWWKRKKFKDYRYPH